MFFTTSCPSLWHNCLPGKPASSWHLPTLHTDQLPDGKTKTHWLSGPLFSCGAGELQFISQRKNSIESNSSSKDILSGSSCPTKSVLTTLPAPYIRLVTAKIINVHKGTQYSTRHRAGPHRARRSSVWLGSWERRRREQTSVLGQLFHSREAFDFPVEK